MELQSIEAVAFSRPGGEIAAPSRGRPVDLVHLARQTFGDRGLEAEVLAMFMHQAVAVRDEIGRADEAARIRLAHGLRGSAAGIGAFGVAECAAAIEASPADSALVRSLAARIDEVRDFICAINR